MELTNQHEQQYFNQISIDILSHIIHIEFTPTYFQNIGLNAIVAADTVLGQSHAKCGDKGP